MVLRVARKLSMRVSIAGSVCVFADRFLFPVICAQSFPLAFLYFGVFLFLLLLPLPGLLRAHVLNFWRRLRLLRRAFLYVALRLVRSPLLPLVCP